MKERIKGMLVNKSSSYSFIFAVFFSRGNVYMYTYTLCMYVFSVAKTKWKESKERDATVWAGISTQAIRFKSTKKTGWFNHYINQLYCIFHQNKPSVNIWECPYINYLPDIKYNVQPVRV